MEEGCAATLSRPRIETTEVLTLRRTARAHVVGLRLACDRVQEQAVHHLERGLLDVFVGAVDGVSRLETYYRFQSRSAKIRRVSAGSRRYF